MTAGLKRGTMMSSSMLTAMVLMLAFGVVMFTFLQISGKTAVAVTEKEICKRSVQQYALLKLPGIDLARTDTIRCPVRRITLEASNSGFVKNEIAKAMYDCFDNFGAGELELFDTRRGSVDNYCVLCSRISFKEKGKTIDNLAEYITTTTIPGKRLKYYEFFKGGGGLSEKELESASVKDIVVGSTVDTSKDYGVLFTYAKTTGVWDKWLAGSVAATAGIAIGGFVSGFFTGGIGWVVAGAAIAGTAGGGVAVAKAPYLESDWQAGVMFVPYDDDVGKILNCKEAPVK